MKKPSGLKKIANSNKTLSAHGVISLLLADHKLLRTLMKQVKSHKSSNAQIVKSFKELEKSVDSHIKAEENTFFTLIKDNLKFEHLVFEGYEEHRVHDTVRAGIHRVKNSARRIQQMKIFCEILEHHLDEEEEKVFPRFKNYTALSTRQKIGKNYLKVRKESDKLPAKRGASRFSK